MIHSQFLRCSTAWGSSAGFSQVSSTKVKAGSSFLFTESSVLLKIKNIWLIFIVTLLSVRLSKDRMDILAKKNLLQKTNFNLNYSKENGMLRHSLATLEGEQDFIFLYRALLSPLSLLL